MSELPLHMQNKVIEKLAEQDGYIVNALVRCSTFKNFPTRTPVPDWPTIFSLIWGDKMCHYSGFPVSLRQMVSDIMREERKREESYDSQEKQVHSIIIDLLYFMYEIQVTTLVMAMQKEAGIC